VDDYSLRVLDAVLDTYQPLLPAIELYGAKAVGKTETARRRAASTLRLDLTANRERLGADPALLRSLPGPLLVDEWPRVPESWDLVRRAVDDGAPPGRFLLTGSATVPKGVSVHSGAGRIIRMRMRPMTLAERGVGHPTVSVKEVLTGQDSVGGHTDVRLADYTHEIVASGFPGIRTEPDMIRRMLLDSYLDDLVQREFPEQGYPVRKPAVLRAWLAAYAAATASTASYSAILDASTPGETDKPAKTTTMAYRDALSQLWMLDLLEPWRPTGTRLQSLGQAPKHFLADPALACRLLNVSEHQLLQGDQGSRETTLGDATLLGALFEHLSVLCVRVYAQASDASVFHMRTHRGEHEVDMILQTEDGKILPVEVKLSQSVTDKDVRHILWLKKNLGESYLPGVVITTGEYAYRRTDGIAVVPLALLGP